MKSVRVDEIIKIFEKMDQESKETLVYRLNRDHKIFDYGNNNYPNMNKKYRFKGMNYFGKTILDRDIYAKTEEELLEYVKNSLNYMFRTKQQLLKVAYNDGHTDEEFESEIHAEVYIHRKYNNCITNYEIVEV